MPHTIAMKTLEILDVLLSMDTVSAKPNRALIDFVEAQLVEVGATVEILEAPGGGKANLYATIGPLDRPGVLLSGHTDVVPVEGQAWTVPPFAMSMRNGRVYGRGTADMKGFVASALACALAASRRSLTTPLHLAFSYDEEIGCVGVHSLIDLLAAAPFKPMMCIVGEPTNLNVATGHKGKIGCRAQCVGRPVHSALAPTGLNAIYLATDLIAYLRKLQSELATQGARDADYDVPYSTVHVGRIDGGVALNIVPEHCSLLFEIRNVDADDPHKILQRIEAAARDIVNNERNRFPEAAIEIDVFNRYPGLDTPIDSDVVRFVQSLTREERSLKVAFGTEGGLFSNQLGIPTVVCGPGSMAQGHQADEYVTQDQLMRCDAMLAALTEHLESGLR